MEQDRKYRLKPCLFLRTQMLDALLQGGDPLLVKARDGLAPLLSDLYPDVAPVRLIVDASHIALGQQTFNQARDRWWGHIKKSSKFLHRNALMSQEHPQESELPWTWRHWGR